VCVCVRVTQFQRTVKDLVASFPPGMYQRITLDLIAACIVFGQAKFTFLAAKGATERTVDTVKYGNFDSDLYPPRHFEDVKEWLLDADAVPTEWDVLQRIRQQHAS
jgi:hypothetical protein